MENNNNSETLCPCMMHEFKDEKVKEAMKFQEKAIQFTIEFKNFLEFVKERNTKITSVQALKLMIVMSQVTGNLQAFMDFMSNVMDVSRLIRHAEFEKEKKSQEEEAE